MADDKKHVYDESKVKTLSSLEHIRLCQEQRDGGESPVLEAALLEGVRSPHRSYTKATLDRIRKNAHAAK